MFAEQFPTHLITCAIRDDSTLDFEIPKNVRVIKINELKDLESKGPFDAIILKELTKEIPDLEALFKTLRTMFENAKMIILARPKNPPLPLPEICLPLWAKLAFARDDIKNAAGYTTVSFSASIPCTIHKFKWESVLFSGCYPVVKSSSKCTREVITNFCKARPPNIHFEEKISMFLLTSSKPDEETS
uniref:Methyltransferase n=1 Tax=Syphacia muris TaxID=451379 RepID=A0A0N5AUJ0_9BILA